ncbi:MAG: cell division protein ZapE [Alphaproteobacteria bacterium]
MADPLAVYEARIADGSLKPDPAQREAMALLQTLYLELLEAHNAPRRNFFQRLTGLGARDKGFVRGVYLVGGVGRGKSMLMDLFYKCLPDTMRKTRVHFHKFMIDVHDYIHTRREGDGIREGIDATLPLLAERIAERSPVLCFDEFHVTDVADAMILGRLFTALFDRGVVVVATSNWPPDRLYEGGLQRDRFLPFIALLKRRMSVFELNSPIDYRALALAQSGVYFYPLSQASKARIDSVFERLSDGAQPYQEVIEVKGRHIPVSAVANGAARFSFAQLCEQPLGAEDYLEIAKRYPTVFLEGIPKMAYDRRNEVVRLMKLIDALYETRTKVVFLADVLPEKLYYGHDHAFEFERTISRLREMQSAEYMNAAAAPSASPALPASTS